MAKIFIFRHGQTTDNLSHTFSGFRDVDLTESGVEEAKTIGEQLKDEKVTRAYCSDQIRSKHTLELVLNVYHKDVPVLEDARIKERDYGDLTNTSKAELNNKNPELTQKYRRSWDFPPPNGESLKMVWEGRVKKFCEDIEDRIREEKINIAVSCTNNTMRLIRMHFEKLSIEEMLSIENPTAQDYAAYLIR